MDFRGVGFDLGEPVEYGTYLGNSPILNLPQGIQEYHGYRSEMGALLGFKKNGAGETGIYVRVGMSFISPEKACANAEEEIPNFDFDGVRAAARGAWNELLGRVQVETEGVDDDTVTLFYSSLYRTHISPADCECFFCFFFLRGFFVGIGGGDAHCMRTCRFGGEPAVELDGAVLRLVLLQRASVSVSMAMCALLT